MPASLRPLTTGQLLDRTFQFYRQNFVLFAGISAVPEVVLLVAQLATLNLVRTRSTSAVLVTSLFSLALVIVSLITRAIATAATTFAVSDIYLENPTSISSSFSRVRGKIGRVIYTTIELGLRVGIGFLLLIVPGVYWAGKYGLAVPAVVLEDIKAKQSFKRSAALTEGAIGRIIAIYFLTWILTVVIAIGIGAAIAAVMPSLAKSAGTVSALAFQYVTSGIVSILVTPVMAIALTLAYYDQRVRKEAFDLESMMSMLGEPVPSTGADALGASS